MRIFCCICKEIFIPYAEIKVTTCGHLYHGSCISRWYEQHHTCPQCRSKLLSEPFRVYFDVDKSNSLDSSTLEHQVEILTDKLRQSEIICKELRNGKEGCEKILDGMKDYVVGLRHKHDTLKTSVKALKEQVTHLSKQTEKVCQLEEEVEVWKTKVKTLQKIETLIKGSSDEIDKMLEITPVTQLAIRQLCTYVGVLKAQLIKNEAKQISLIEENKNLKKSVVEEKKKSTAKFEEELKKLRESNSVLKKNFYVLKNKVKEYEETYSSKADEIHSSAASTQGARKRLVFNIDCDILKETENQPKKGGNAEVPKAISNWEEIVCAGPSRNFGSIINKPKTFVRNLQKERNHDYQRCNEQYAFDGLGGRKKIRLGGPTPKNEFERIKKSKDKNLVNLKYKKIFDYYHSGDN